MKVSEYRWLVAYVISGRDPRKLDEENWIYEILAGIPRSSGPNILTPLTAFFYRSPLFDMLVEFGLEINPDEETVENNSNNNDENM